MNLISKMLHHVKVSRFISRYLEVLVPSLHVYPLALKNKKNSICSISMEKKNWIIAIEYALERVRIAL